MKKLNNKGYITVEILIASIMSAVIAVFLIELTIKLVTKTDDAYVGVLLNTDKALIIDNVKNSIENDINECDVVSSIDNTENNDDSKEWEFCFAKEDCGCSTLIIESKVKEDEKEYKQISYLNNKRNTVYEKEIYNIEDLGFGVKYDNTGDNIGDNILINITGNNIFSDNDFIVNIPISNKYVENVSQVTSYTVQIMYNNNVIIAGEVIENGVFIGVTSELNDSFASSIGINISCSHSGIGSVSKSESSNDLIFTIENINDNIVCNIIEAEMGS